MECRPTNHLFLMLFLTFYTLSIFVIHISNSQYVVSIDGYKSHFDNIKLFLYLLSFISLAFFYKFNRSTFIDLVISAVFLISYYNSRITISVFIFFLFAKYLKFSTIIKTFLFAVFLGFLFVFITYSFDLYEYSFVDMYRSDGTYRSPLGYKYPTYLPNVSLFFYLGWIFLRKNKITFIELSFISLVNFFVYYYTDTRTIFYLVNLLLLIVLFIKLFNLHYKTFLIGRLGSFFTIYLFVILSLVSIYLQIVYDPNIEWMDNLNKALSGRLYYGHKAFVDYGISLLGQKIDYVSVLDEYDGNSLFVIDSGFMKVLMDYGIILYILITYGFIQAGRKIVKKNDVYMGLILIISLLDISVNPHLILLDFNPFFFALAYFGIYKDNLFK